MLFFHNDFISAGNPNNTYDAFGHSYILNENGHRCKSIDSIDKSNYILFAGCSHTKGDGLPIEETYPFITSKLLGMDYYNLAAGGAGCDVMFYNLFTWLHKYDHKPKLLILQWPFQLRYIRPGENYIQPEGSWSKDKYLDFMLQGERVGYFSLRTTLYENLINLIKIPKIFVSFPDYRITISDYITFQGIDKAYDEQHNGPKSHKLLAELLVDKCKLKYDKYLNVDIHTSNRRESI